jgi:cytochrome c
VPYNSRGARGTWAGRSTTGGIANRIYIAGMLPNTPENMMTWIQAPQEVNQHTAMQNMGVTEPEARDIVGYLYTLK